MLPWSWTRMSDVGCWWYLVRAVGDTPLKIGDGVRLDAAGALEMQMASWRWPRAVLALTWAASPVMMRGSGW